MQLLPHNPTHSRRLDHRAEPGSRIAYFVLAGSLFASLLEFFPSLPALP
jgi:hypothetical protein